MIDGKYGNVQFVSFQIYRMTLIVYILLKFRDTFTKSAIADFENVPLNFSAIYTIKMILYIENNKGLINLL